MTFGSRSEALRFGVARGVNAFLLWLVALSEHAPWPPWSKDAHEASRSSRAIVDRELARWLVQPIDTIRSGDPIAPECYSPETNRIDPVRTLLYLVPTLSNRRAQELGVKFRDWMTARSLGGPLPYMPEIQAMRAFIAEHAPERV
jgi:hypothetical protein